MATNKKSYNKKGKASSDKNAKPKQKRPSKEELEQLRIEDELKSKKRNQTFSLILFAVSLIMFSIVIIPAESGTLWHGIRGLVFGFFGYAGFILPFVLTYTALMMSMEKIRQSFAIKIAESVALVLCLSSLMFVICHDGSLDFAKDTSKEFMMYFKNDSIGWGFFGAIIGELLMLISFSKAPAIAILIILTFLVFMLLTGFTLIRILTGMKKAAEKIETAKKNREIDPKNVDPETGEVLPKQKRGHLFVYGDDDLIENAEEKQEPEAPAEEPDVIDIPFDMPFTKKPEEDEPIIEDELKDIFTLAAEKQAAEEEKKLTKSEISTQSSVVAKEIENTQQKEDESNYILPPLDCLRMPVKNPRTASQADLKATADKLIEALNSFNVSATVVDVVPGPAVTRYELAPAPGVKISKFTGLADDLALHLAAPAGVRIEAPIPNKSAIGIEVPNRGRTTVTMREIVDSDIYRQSKSKLNVALGKDIAGNIVCADLAKMPHLLVAGTTGSGKSVCLNAMIVSILYNAKPSEVKILLIDPKSVEFAVYNGIPHLLVPVVSDPRKAAGALGWAVTEMVNRYNSFTTNGVRDIAAYNKLCEQDESLKKMPHIVIVIDELSDLMSVAQSEVENSITRLAQMARAAGMHLVVATQRPSVDVITGLIKANIPSRIALSVSSQVDSRTILDASGAEKLLGLGDMLFNPIGKSKPQRVQGCFLSDEEIEKVVDFVKTQETSAYSDDIQQEIEKQALAAAPKKSDKSDGGAVSDADNEIILKAAELVIDNPDKASISSLQRHLSLGFAKAGRIMDALEDRGVVGPHAGSKPRKVLMTKAQWYEMNAMAPNAVMGGDDDDE